MGVVITVRLTASWGGSGPAPSSGLALFLLCLTPPPPPHSPYPIPLQGGLQFPLPWLRGSNQTIRQEPTEGDDRASGRLGREQGSSGRLPSQGAENESQ